MAWDLPGYLTWEEVLDRCRSLFLLAKRGKTGRKVFLKRLLILYLACKWLDSPLEQGLCLALSCHPARGSELSRWAVGAAY